MTLALGIDPGTATTGYGLVRLTPEGSLQVVTFGVIVTPPHTPAQQRLLELFTDIQELLKLHKPDTCAVERLFFQRNVSTAMAVGQARGVGGRAWRGRAAPRGGLPGDFGRSARRCGIVRAAQNRGACRQ